MKALKLNVAKDFTTSPGARYRHEGNYSGEEFREKVLLPAVSEALKNKAELVVCLDGVMGYGTSFLEEAFGGLIREDNLPYRLLAKTLRFVTNEEPYLDEEIREYMKDADAEVGS